jgi:hypothetical protein
LRQPATQYRQDGAVVDRVEKLRAVPARGQRSGFRLAVADRARDEQVRIVEGGAERVREDVAQLAAFVDRPRRLRGRVARDAAGKRKLFEEALHPGGVAGDVRKQLAIRAFQIGIGNDRGPAVTGTGEEDRVEIARGDRTVEMRDHEVQTRRGSPVAEQPRFDVLAPQRLAQERVVEQVNLTDREIVRRPPVGVETT